MDGNVWAVLLEELAEHLTLAQRRLISERISLLTSGRNGCVDFDAIT